MERLEVVTRSIRGDDLGSGAHHMHGPEIKKKLKQAGNNSGDALGSRV